MAAAELDFCLLGPLAVGRGELRLPALPAKQRVLLAALLLNANRMVSIDQLAEITWGPAPPASARATLRNYVKDLRKALSGLGASRISTLPGGYLIRVGDDELDLFRFEFLRASAARAAADRAFEVAAARLRTALSLWRGEPLADVPSDWLAVRQVPRLAEMRQQAVEALAEADLQLGRHAEVIPDLRQLVGSHPLRERLHALLMLALYRDGQQAEALAAYRRARHLLQAELGAEPGPELRKLHQQVLAADPDLLGPQIVRAPHPAGQPEERSRLAAPQAQLPADLADFTGRAEQVSQLTAMLTGRGDAAPPGAVVISAVAGPGGIGKTALAVHAAHRVAGQFPDGQLYLNLRGSSRRPVTAADALARLMRDLGTEPGAVPPDEAERAARYRSLLAGSRLLLVLDDARDAAQVRPLLPGSAGCGVLITSRQALAGLESARLLHLGALSADEAAVMFARIAGPERMAAEPDAAGALLGLCAGLPLAIRIAAARLTARPGWSIAALADRLQDARRRLDELHAGDLAIRTSFLASYAELRQRARSAGQAPDRAFRLLGLADGPDISLPGAAALLGADPEAVEPVLELLADASLLQAATPGRYRFHDLLKIYAAERAHAEDGQAARDQAVRRLLSWYLHTAVAAGQLINPHRRHLASGAEPGISPLAFASYPQALAWLDAEHANLLHAVDQAASQDQHDIAWRLAYELWDLFNLRGRSGTWIHACTTGLASTRCLGDRAAEGYMLGNLAASYLHAGQPEAALDCMRQSLVIMRETGKATDSAVCLVNIGVVLTELGRAEAIEPLTEAISLFRSTGDRTSEAFAHCGIAAVHSQHGTLSDALRHYQQGLDRFREVGDLGSAGETLVDISQLQLRHGQLGAAIRDATEAAEISLRTGSRRNLGRALAVLGSALAGRGRPEDARSHWLEAVAIFTDLGSPQAAEVAASLEALDRTPEADPAGR